MYLLRHTVRRTRIKARMEDKEKKALRKCHLDLQRDIDVKSIMPDLRSELPHLQYDSLENLPENDEQVDELLHILLHARGGSFHKFCTILRMHEYHHLVDKLHRETGKYKIQQLYMHSYIYI